jgi:hypothetical protein
MFEVEDLLVPLVAAFVARDAAALIAHFDVTRIKSHLDGLARRGRRRIEIGPHPYAAEAVHARE